MALDLLAHLIKSLWGFWLALAAAVASILYFRKAKWEEPTEKEIEGRPRSALTNLLFRRWFYWILEPLEKELLAWKVSPDALNWAGLWLNILAAIAIGAGAPGTAAALIAFGGACDILDGRIARKTGAVSLRGAFTDSTLDRYADAANFAGLLWLLHGQKFPTLLVFLAACGSLLVSYARARGEALGVPDAPGFAQRPERIVTLVFALLASAVEASLVSFRGGVPQYYILSGALLFLAGTTQVAAAERFSHARKFLSGKERAAA
ncbi:MAG: CDP-alcohol phosphatidyltransferase family protein [Bdellovibrionota bacterium]